MRPRRKRPKISLSPHLLKSRPHLLLLIRKASSPLAQKEDEATEVERIILEGATTDQDVDPNF